MRIVLLLLVSMFLGVACEPFDQPKVNNSGGQSEDDEKCGLYTELSWTPPTKNVDGSELKDLRGFKIYRGVARRNYSEVVEILDPSISNYRWEDLQDGVKNYFTATAFNSQATDNESAYSNEIDKTATACPENSTELTEEEYIQAMNEAEAMVTFLNHPALHEYGEIKYQVLTAKSKYDVLKSAYSNAQEVPDFSDFHEYGDKNSRVCVEVYDDNKDQVSNIMASRFKKTIVGGGPLLPPEVIEKIIVAHRPSLFTHFENTEMEIKRREMISRTELSDDQEWSVRLRKEGTLIHFKKTLKENRKSKTAYGYCYYTEKKRKELEEGRPESSAINPVDATPSAEGKPQYQFVIK